jgi:hypothetical protein
MKILSAKKTSPPPRKTPRRFTVELTEGEADFILGLLASARLGAFDSTRLGQSPFRYAGRLLRGFQNMLGQRGNETDAFLHSYGEVWFGLYTESYRPLYDDRSLDLSEITVAW